MCGFYCVTLIEYMIARKPLLDYASSFSLKDYQESKI